MSSIIHKYLDIIKTQDEEIEKLKKELQKQRNINSDLRIKKRLYKENCTYWKSEYDNLNKSVVVVGKNISEAIVIYGEKQGC